MNVCTGGQNATILFKIYFVLLLLLVVFLTGKNEVHEIYSAGLFDLIQPGIIHNSNIKMSCETLGNRRHSGSD